MAITEFISWSIENWYLYVILFLIFVYSKYKDKEKIGNMNLATMYFILEVGFYFMLIYLIQTKLFPEHYYFLFSIPVFILIWGYAVNYILSKDDVYLIETPIMGEEFLDTLNGNKIMSMTTRIRLMIMDRDLYNTKQHIGEINNPLLNTSRCLKFADYIDDNTDIIYHSIYPQLQNINFYTRTASWLKIKEDLPKIVDENIGHTWLEGFKLMAKQKALSEKFAYDLKGVKDITDKVPFQLHKDLEEYMEFVKSYKHYDSQIENNESNNSNENNTESSEGE